MRISPINVHLAAAKETVRHVQGAMDIGTTNKFFSNFWGFPPASRVYRRKPNRSRRI